MSFNVSMIYHGVGGSVLNHAQDPTRLMLALVDGSRSKAGGQAPLADGESPPRIHHAFLRLATTNLKGHSLPVGRAPHPAGGGFEESSLVWYLAGRRVQFDVDQKSKASLCVDRSFDGVPRIELACPGAGTIAEELLTTAPPDDGRIAAQVLIESGRVAGQQPHVDERWRFSPTLSGSDWVVGPMAQTAVEWTQVERFVIRTTPFGGSRPEEVELTAEEGETIHFSVNNLCSENALGWPGEPAPEVGALDDDFRWTYRLCEAQSRLRDAYSEIRTPTPDLAIVNEANVPLPGARALPARLPVPQLVFRPSGVNPVICYQARFEAASF